VNAASNRPRFQPGDAVALREIWHGRVWAARPTILVADEPGMTMFHVPSGIRYLKPVDEHGRPLRLYTDVWRLEEDVWEAPNFSLSFAFPETAYGVILFFDASALRGFYVNLQAPLTRSPIGFDTVEHLLDIVIAADRSSWSWKDEGELSEAVRRGLFTAKQATAFRTWGERAVRHVVDGEPPFDRDWSTWRPDPTWQRPRLPGAPQLLRV
jgi:predicted RNA-binding protein associated with RNAse of E/G family